MPTKDSNFKTSFPEIPRRLDLKKRSTPEGVLPYDLDNLYPQRAELMIQGSATASACADLFKKHLYGEGFLDKSFGEKIINKEGQTTNDLLHDVIDDSVLGRDSVAIHINYNALLQAVEFQKVPMKFVRIWDDKTEKHKNQYL